MSRVQQGVNDLYTWCLNNGEFGQRLINEWVGLDENNRQISMNDITRASSKKVKWKCSKGHEWFADLGHRTSNRRCCPYCSGNKVTKETSLQEWCKNNGTFGQQLINEWTGLDENNQPILIDSIAKGSHKKVKWKCSKGHEWYAVIKDRTYYKSGCAYCCSIGTSYPEQYLYNALKQLYPNTENRCRVLKSLQNPQGIEFDIGVPEIPLCIEYSPTHWHEGKEEIDECKKQVCKEHGVRLIQIIEDSYNELEFKMDDDYICFHMVDTMKTDIMQVILEHILKSLNHTLDEIDLDKVEEDTQNATRMKGVQQGVNDLKTWCLSNGAWGQQLIKEWTGLDENNQPISIDSMAMASNKRVKWKCSKGHEWCVTISHRTYSKSRCPYCFGNHKISKERSLQEWCLYNGEWGQQLISEWTGLDENNQPISMDNVARGSNKKAKWKCNKSHEWFARIVDRTIHKSGCPYCAGKKK